MDDGVPPGHRLTMPTTSAFSWAQRFRLRQRLKGSLWFVPLLGGLLGAGLAAADIAIEAVVQVPPAWRYSSDAATGVLAQS